MIDWGALHLSIRRQGELIGWNRSPLSYMPATESACHVRLMRLIDEPYPKTPFYGWPRMTAQVRRLGLQVNPTRVPRVMPPMGRPALYPKPRTNAAAKGHQIDPYRLDARALCRPTQVWSADITSGRRAKGVTSLVAIIDW